MVLTPRRLVSSRRKMISAGDGSKRARSPGRARRKPLKPLRGECRMFSGVTVVTTLACLFYFTCEAAGASSTRHSLRPPNGGTRKFLAKLARIARRECEVVSRRHCEERKRRSNPFLLPHGLLRFARNDGYLGCLKLNLHVRAARSVRSLPLEGESWRGG